MENTKVPYHIKMTWHLVIGGVIAIICSSYCLINNIVPRRSPGLGVWWFLIACCIIVLLEGGLGYTLTEKEILCYIFGIPVKKFRWEQVSYVVFFPQTGNTRRDMEPTLLIVTGDCPVYQKDRQDTNSFAWYQLTHWRRIVRIILPEKKDQEILKLAQELCKAPVEIKERKAK